MKPVQIADRADETGEGPLYHPDQNCLYWVDIPRGRLYRHDVTSEEHEIVLEGPPLGGFTIQTDGSLLLLRTHGEITLWRDGSETVVTDEIPGERDSRFNDVIADPCGRVFCGTMPPDGRLYRLDTDGTLTTLLEGVEISNGLGFTPRREGMYLTETNAETIWRFDYDEGTGKLSNKRPFVETANGPGVPDGMTVDKEGYVWSARWNGGCITRHDPNDGQEVDRVELPARKVSAITFGGPGYEDAYVTTATAGNSRKKEGRGAGALFRVTPAVGGVPEFRSRIRP